MTQPGDEKKSMDGLKPKQFTIFEVLRGMNADTSKPKPVEPQSAQKVTANRRFTVDDVIGPPISVYRPSQPKPDEPKTEKVTTKRFTVDDVTGPPISIYRPE